MGVDSDIGTIERLPGEGRLGLVLTLYGAIPAAVYRETNTTYTSVRDQAERDFNLRSSRVNLDFGVSIGLPYAMKDDRTYKQTDRSAAERYEVTQEIVVAVGCDPKVANTLLDVKDDPRQRDMILGVPLSSEKHRDYDADLIKRRWKALFRNRIDLVSRHLAFAPWTPTIVDREGFFELLDEEVELFKGFGTVVGEASEKIHAKAIWDFYTSVREARGEN